MVPKVSARRKPPTVILRTLQRPPSDAPPPNGITIESDTLLPSQWIEQIAQTPERRLLVAVLKDAIDCLRYPPEHENHLDAVAWFESDADVQPFCFVSLCDALGFAPTALRKRILAQRGAIRAPRGMWQTHKKIGGDPIGIAPSSGSLFSYRNRGRQ